MSKSDDPNLQDYGQYITSALRTEGGHLSIGRGGFILYFGRGSRLPGTGEKPNYEYAIPLLLRTPQSAKTRKRDRDRTEALRLAGGPRLPRRDRAVALARERGLVRTQEFTAIGIPRCYLTRMCEEGLLEKVSYGLYRAIERKVA